LIRANAGQFAGCVCALRQKNQPSRINKFVEMFLSDILLRDIEIINRYFGFRAREFFIGFFIADAEHGRVAASAPKLLPRCFAVDKID
jgi:hypothetical protein